MEILQKENMNFISFIDIQNNLNIQYFDFVSKLEQYEYKRKKKIRAVEANDKIFILIDDLVHFLKSINQNDLRKQLLMYCEKKPQRKLSRAHRYEIAYTQKYKCNHCTILLEPNFEIDHIIELCDGGFDEIDNLQALCALCHSKKTRFARLKRDDFFKNYAVKNEMKKTTTKGNIFSPYFRKNKKNVSKEIKKK